MMKSAIALSILMLIAGCVQKGDQSKPKMLECKWTVNGVNQTVYVNPAAGCQSLCTEKITCSNGREFDATSYNAKTGVCEQLMFAGGTPCFNESAPVESQVEVETEESNSQDKKQTETETPKNILTIKPVGEIADKLSDELLDEYKIDCDGLEDKALADCILNWQNENMIYDTSTTGSEDAMHFNELIPGIWPVSEFMVEKTDSNGKVHGLCFDYAAIYCAIADVYDLDCRIMESTVPAGEGVGSLGEVLYKPGLGYEQFLRMVPHLEKNNLNYEYEQVREIKTIRGGGEYGPGHYWAEAFVDGNWTVFDATSASTGGNTQKEFKDTGKFEESNWNYVTEIDLDELAKQPKYDPETEDQSGFGPNMAPSEPTEITPKTVLDGEATAPEFDTCEEVCDFIVQAGDKTPCLTDCEEYMSYYTCYEDCSGDKFNMACDFICDEDATFPECYESCSGRALDLSCEGPCLGDLD